MLSGKTYSYFFIVSGCAGFFVVSAYGLFEYTYITHWLVALVMGGLIAGFVTALWRMLTFAEKRYSKAALDWYRSFSKRKMNIGTISVVALTMTAVLVILFVVNFCFTQIMEFGAVCLKAI